MTKATAQACIFQGCANEYVPTKKYPGPHCPACTDRYLAIQYTDRGRRLPSIRTTR